MEELKDSVIKILISQHDFDLEEATETVERSLAEDSEHKYWHENSDAEDLANMLATDEDGE